MQQHFHASHKGVALNPSVYAQPWAVWPCGGGTRPGEARNWGADQPRSTCVERTSTFTHTRTRVSTHKYTYTHTHTSPFPASSSFPAPPVVLVTAIRPGHHHSSLSPPVVLVTAIRPGHRLSCMSLPCVQRCHAAMLALRPRSTCVERTSTRVHTHANTRTRTHTHTLRHSLRPRRSLRRLSSLSLPVVLVTAIRPSCVAHTAVCSAAMLPCLLAVRAAVVLRGPRSVEMPAVAASSMTQIDGWTRGAVKARKGWPITPFRESGNGNWLIFGSFSLN